VEGSADGDGGDGVEGRESSLTMVRFFAEVRDTPPGGRASGLFCSYLHFILVPKIF
jgi:hypothetical protein